MSTYQLYNDDCLVVLERLIGDGVKVDAIICDPPYGMTANQWDSVIPYDRLWVLLKEIRKPKANIVLFSKQPFTTMLNHSNIDEFRYEVIWKKQQATNPMSAKKRIMPIHENISVFYDGLGTYNPQFTYDGTPYGGFSSDTKKIGESYGNVKSFHNACTDGRRYPTSVLEYNNVRNGEHPTQKPVDLMEYLVMTYTNEGDTVLDFCMGSGSTGVASCENGRKFIGIEKDRKYFDIAERRLKRTEMIKF